MKLTLQLVVVVLIAPTKFRDNLFKFTLYTIIIIYEVGDTRCHLGRHALIQHNFFHEIRTLTENKHARILVIGQQQIQKPMKLSQIEKRISQTTNCRVSFIDLYLVFPRHFTPYKHSNFTGTVLWYQISQSLSYL